MEDLFVGYLEDKHYKKIKKSYKPVVFTGRKAALWAIFLIVLLAAFLAWTFTLPVEPDGAWLGWPLAIFFSLGAIWGLFISCANLNARVVLTPDSISITGRIRDAEDGLFADFKASLRQAFIFNRHVEMKWSEIERISRPSYRDPVLIFYTKSGQIYFFYTLYFDVKLMPTLRRYAEYKNDYRWWL